MCLQCLLLRGPGARHEEGLKSSAEEGKSSQILFCSTWQEGGKRSCTVYPQDVLDLWGIEGRPRRAGCLKHDFQSLYLYVSEILVLSGQKFGVRI